MNRFLGLLKKLEPLFVFLGVGAIVLIPFQIRNFSNQEGKNALDLLLVLTERAETPTSLKIFKRIVDGQPILLENKGPYAEEDLDDFLNNYESVGSAYSRKLISLELACDWFGDNINEINKNKEISKYFSENNPKYFEKLKMLATDFNNSNCNQ